MKNISIRIALLKNQCPQWKLADALGISETSLARKLRKEMTEEEQKRICNLIEEVSGDDE